MSPSTVAAYLDSASEKASFMCTVLPESPQPRPHYVPTCLSFLSPAASPVQPPAKATSTGTKPQ